MILFALVNALMVVAIIMLLAWGTGFICAFLSARRVVDATRFEKWIGSAYGGIALVSVSMFISTIITSALML